VTSIHEAGIVKLGLTLPSFVDDPAVPLAVARAADEAGLDGIFVYDHLFRRAADGTRRPALEGVALLGAVAAATTRIAVGALVFRAWSRPPSSLASAVATVSRLAPGRMVAAIGAGDSESREENETFGLGFGTMTDRVDRLTAAVRATRDQGARVWVGGKARAVREVAAREADGWNAWGGSSEWFGTAAGAVRAAAVRPSFECTWGGLTVLGDDDASAREKADRLGAGGETIVGGPDTVARALDAYGRAGADWVILAPVDSSDPENAARLGHEVKASLATGERA
jgi:alkanesulfonate monooxygenase SsuD/methylene tetrahydromethanopterin reductase-like flavin-dependent oxidoreductase (luciferase family)